MENQEASSQAVVNEYYNYAANLLVNEKKSSKDVQSALVGKGLSESAALTIVYNLEAEIKNAKILADIIVRSYKLLSNINCCCGQACCGS